MYVIKKLLKRALIISAAVLHFSHPHLILTVVGWAADVMTVLEHTTANVRRFF